MSALQIVSRKVALVVAAAASLLSVACAGEEAQPAYASTDIEDQPGATGQPVTCESGAVQSCTIWLGRHGDLANCIHGVDVCTDGVWSGCIDEHTLAENPELYANLVGDAL